MGGVADEHDATTVPLFDFQPFDRCKMNLLVAVQSRQIILHESAEGGEAAVKPVASPFHRIVTTGLCDIGKTISAVPDRADTEETPIAQPELNAIGLRLTDWYQAAPHHLSTIGRWIRPQHELARRRMNPIGADHKVVFTGRTIVEPDRHVVIVLAQRHDPGPETQGDRTRLERVVQLRAFDSNERIDAAP